MSSDPPIDNADAMEEDREMLIQALKDIASWSRLGRRRPSDDHVIRIARHAMETIKELQAEVERLRPVLEAARHLHTQSYKDSLGCSWGCRNMRDLFVAVKAAAASGE